MLGYRAKEVWGEWRKVGDLLKLLSDAIDGYHFHDLGERTSASDASESVNPLELESDPRIVSSSKLVSMDEIRETKQK